MERFREIGGVILSRDMSEIGPGPDSPLHMTGGENMLRRGARGLRRRPGFGALIVSGGASVGIGSTNPISLFELRFPRGHVGLMAVHDGDLFKYENGAWVTITTGIQQQIYQDDHGWIGLDTDGVMVASLGGYGLIASGKDVLKYDGHDLPSRLGSIKIANMEPSEVWSPDRTSDDQIFLGTQSLKIAETDDPDGYTLELDNLSDSLKNSEITGALEVATLGDEDSGGVYEVQAIAVNMGQLLAGKTVTKIGFWWEAQEDFNSPVAVGVRLGELLFDRPEYAHVITDNDAPYADTSVPAATFNTSGKKEIQLDYPTPVPDNGQSAYIVFYPQSSAGGSGVEQGWGQMYGGKLPYPYKTYGIRNLPVGQGQLYVQDTLAAAIEVGYYPTADGGINLLTGYPDASQIAFFIWNQDNITEARHLGSRLRFYSDDNNYFETAFIYNELQRDNDGFWLRVLLTRGNNSGENGRFSVVGSPSWSGIKKIEWVCGGGAWLQNHYIDNIHLLHQWAPPYSDKVFRANSRAMVVVDDAVYYSERDRPNIFYVDTILQFPDRVIGIADAGPRTVFVTDSETWQGIPIESFPDFKLEKLEHYGCVHHRAITEIKYQGKPGAAWISKNKGLLYWDGTEGTLPMLISGEIDDIFAEGGTNNQNMDYSRIEEIRLVYHKRYNELWILYPTLYTGETNLKYGWVLDCDSGTWMPRFVWNGSNNIIDACLYRDPVDDLYKMVFLDSNGDVWVEGFVGSTELDGTNSNDGYVDESTPGNPVKGYIELPYIGGDREDMTDKDQIFHDLHVKYLPNTTEAFSLDFDYKLAAKGGNVDQEVYFNEEEVVMNPSWVSIGSRSTTPAAVGNVIERNVKVGDDVKGHALAVRVGQVDSGGSSEWELYGVSVVGHPRYGKR